MKVQKFGLSGEKYAWYITDVFGLYGKMVGRTERVL